MISKSRLGHLCGNVLYTVYQVYNFVVVHLHFANIAKYDLHEKVLVTVDDAQS